MLILKNVYMKYKGSNQEVLKDINLTLPDNGLIFILGASGSGKSTLLNLIAGFIKPTKGKIFFNNKDITKLSNKELNEYIANDISVIHQKYNLINYLNVDDNLKLKNKYYDLNILSKLHIDHIRKKKVNILSGGECQRIAIARSLVNSSSIILADEPTGALDTNNSKRIMKILKQLSNNHLVIVVTHNNDLIKYGDQVITIKDGIIKKNVHNFKVLNNKIKNDKLKFKKDIKSIVLKNIYYKLKRNILTILAFSIGLITLLSVLSISKGFTKSLDESEKTTLASYPITISENSYDIESEFKSIFDVSSNNVDKVFVASNHINKIDANFIDYVNSLEKYSKTIEYVHNIDNILITSISNIDSFYESIEIISGAKINNKNEVLLLIDKNHSISNDMAHMLGLDNNVYDYEEIINSEIIIDKIKYKICGIALGKEESFYIDMYGLYSNDNFSSIPLSVSITPKDYPSKLKIINSLKEYGDIEFTDYASSIKNISISIVDAITVILIIFSLISLIITSFMIGIITYISVLERVKDIGILKSIGYTNNDIKKIFYLENIIIAIISCILSITLVLIISIPINNILYNLTGFNNILLIDIINIIYVLLIGISISMVGSMIPIRKIKSLDILSALNYEQ